MMPQRLVTGAITAGHVATQQLPQWKAAWLLLLRYGSGAPECLRRFSSCHGSDERHTYSGIYGYIDVRSSGKWMFREEIQSGKFA